MASPILRNHLLGPISVAQFREHFHRAWAVSHGREPPDEKPERKTDGVLGIPRRLGLAVSGGTDSMALAYLCRQLEVQDAAAGGATSVTAFVVDHRAREESSREARAVAGWLSDMGLKTQVLELDWSQLAARHDQKRSSSMTKKKNASASMPSAFETYARQLRYQALGTACRENGIETLLMGHHQDDNVETTIWRLCSGARGAGLTGIPQVARMPECHGLFGVAESGSRINVQEDRNTRRARVRINDSIEGNVSFPSPAKNKKRSAQQTPTTSPGISIAAGGILVCRPLLSFPKASLVATCHENYVPYVSDPTNFDPTLTPRNAIRSLFAANAFPRALQPPAILSLIRASQTLLQSTIDLSSRLLESQCRVLDFNFKSGTMVLQILPRISTAGDSSSNTHPLSNLSTLRIQQTQAVALRRMTELISPSPANHHPLRSFDQYVPQVFPSLTNQEGNPVRRPFTLGGVMFHPLTPEPSASNLSPSKTRGPTPSASDPASSRPPQTAESDIWLLSRQPFMRDRIPFVRVDVPLSGDLAHNPSSSSSSPSMSNPFTPWELWDDRFWFRFRALRPTPTPSPPPTGHDSQGYSRKKPSNLRIMIRPLQQSDFQKISSGNSVSLRPTKRGREKTQPAYILSQLRKFLSDEVSGSIRFTVPVVAVQEVSKVGSETGSEEGDEEHLLALPTMPFNLISGVVGRSNMMEISLGGEVWTLEWEWMYKMIDIEALRLMGWPVGQER